jgi:competence protein ComGC
MKELTRMDYMYIIIIILLVISLIWIILPFVYNLFNNNGQIDSSDCIANMESIQCNQTSESLKVCEYQCTYKDGSNKKQTYYWRI